jgi:hypothetical protein
VWVLFRAPCPTPDGRTARDLYERRIDWIDDAMRASACEHGCTFHRAWHAADGSAFYALAHWRTREGAQAFFEEWQIDAEPGETAVRLEGDVGLVPLGGD